MAKIKAIEEDFGQPIAEVLADYAKEYSYTFTVLSLGLDWRDVYEYKDLFKPRFVGYVPRPHITKRNLANAPRYWGYTISELAAKSGRSKNTIRQRIKAGWDLKKVLSSKKHNGDSSNFGKNRNNETWRNKINEECRSAEAWQMKSI